MGEVKLDLSLHVVGAPQSCSSLALTMGLTLAGLDSGSTSCIRQEVVGGMATLLSLDVWGLGVTGSWSYTGAGAH